MWTLESSVFVQHSIPKNNFKYVGKQLPSTNRTNLHRDKIRDSLNVSGPIACRLPEGNARGWQTPNYLHLYPDGKFGIG